MSAAPMEIEPLDAPSELPPGTRALAMIELPELLADELSWSGSPLSGHLDSFPQVLSHIACGNNECYLGCGPDLPSWVRLPTHPVVLLNSTIQPWSEPQEPTKAVVKKALVDTDVVQCDAHSSSHGEWRGHQSGILQSYEVVGMALVFTKHVNVTAPTVELRVNKTSKKTASMDSFGFSFNARHKPTPKADDDTSAAVVAVEGSAVVLPASAVYRVRSAELIDPSKPGSFSIVRVLMVHPDRAGRSLVNIPTKGLEVIHWPGESRLVTMFTKTSPEEDRVAKQIQQLLLSSDHSDEEDDDEDDWLSPVHQDIPPPMWPQVVFQSARERPRRIKEAHLVSLQCISELSNSLEWWTADLSARKARVAMLQDAYLGVRLRVGVRKALDTMANEIRGVGFRSGANDGEDGDSEQAEQAASDETIEEQDDLSVVLAQLGLIKTIHGRLSGLPTASASLAVSADELLSLLIAYRAAESTQHKADVLQKYLGEAFPVQLFLPRLDSALQDVEAGLARWCEWLVRVVSATRRASADGLMISPATEVLVRDDISVRAVNEMLSMQLKPLLKTYRTKTIARLWDPGHRVGRTVVPTFSVPSTGSIQTRMEATIGKAVFFPRTWLKSISSVPSDVTVDSAGNAKFLSYIRGLHPRQHHDVYKLIEATVSTMLPLFEASLAKLSSPAPVESRFWSNAGKPLRFPVVAVADSPTNAFRLRGRPLQLIVEVITEWTDDNPTFQAACDPPMDRLTQESLVATGVSFLADDNIADTRMHFQPRSSSLRYGESIGFVTAQAGRCVVYPSDYETRMPLKRLDESKPGTLTMIKLHLVNPFDPAVSTANLEPEFREWVVDATVGQVARHFDLPTSVHDEIVAMLPWSDQLISDSTWVTS